jgi:histidyl-tRNA synthetase
VAIIGASELEAGAVSVKNMTTGEQRTVPRDEAASAIGRRA